MKVSIEELSHYDYVLPVSLRRELKDPIGELIVPDSKRYEEVLENPPKEIICVGDIVSKTFLERRIFPKIIITDGVTKREKIELLEAEKYVKKIVKNPAATITSNAWLAIREAIKSNQKTHLFVEGEEDLLTIPVILEADKNMTVFYGQPNEGMVLVIPSEQLKDQLIELLLKFERKNPSNN